MKKGCDREKWKNKKRMLEIVVDHVNGSATDCNANTQAKKVVDKRQKELEIFYHIFPFFGWGEPFSVLNRN